MINSSEIIKLNDIIPNKALGQNFLVDCDAIQKIIDLTCCAGQPVLEIGPGVGALTSELVHSASHLLAVEIDKHMVEILSKEVTNDNLTILNSDFLKVSNLEIVNLLGINKFLVVGNLPYYITSDICQKLLSNDFDSPRMVLMMQEEAALRFTAKPCDKNYVPLSIISQQRYCITKRLSLSPSAYYPSPEVNSVVLLFERKNSELIDNYSKVVKASFAMRRKTLRNNLRSIADETTIANMLNEVGLASDIRAEAVSVEQFVKLTEVYNQCN